MADQNFNSMSLPYPLTKTNFLVSISADEAGDSSQAVAAFTEVTGVDATVDVIEFRQGNAHSLAPLKVPGLVKHGNVTLKMGYTIGSAFKQWIIKCLSETRGAMPRCNVTIELFNSNNGVQSQAWTTTSAPDAGDAVCWVLNDAWVCKYNGPDLNASASEIAIESVEIAYESLYIPK